MWGDMDEDDVDAGIGGSAPKLDDDDTEQGSWTTVEGGSSRSDATSWGRGAAVPDGQRRGGRDRRHGGGGRHEDRGSYRGGRGGRRPMNPRDPRIDTAPPLSECKPIEHRGDRWKPGVMDADGEGSQTQSLKSASLNHQEKIRRAKGILNKFTMEKFEKLSDKVVEMVTTQSILADVTGAILEKACAEKHFSALYAEMCVKLSQVELPVALKDKAALFRRLLLNKAGEIFDQGFAEVSRTRKALEDLQREAVAGKDVEGTAVAARGSESKEVGATAAEEDTDVSVEQLATKAKRVKSHLLGHINFIGDLFTKGLVPNKVMHQCIVRLFGADSLGGDPLDAAEDDVECLCKLLTTTGKRLDSRDRLNVLESVADMAEVRRARKEKELGKKKSKKGKDESKEKKRWKKRFASLQPVSNAAYLDRYFAALAVLKDQTDRLSSRTCFAIRDLEELRAAKWKPRRKVETAKRMKEIKAEALQAHGRADEAAAVLQEADDDGGWSTVSVGAKAAPRRSPTSSKASGTGRQSGTGAGAGASGTGSAFDMLAGGKKKKDKDGKKKSKKEKEDKEKKKKKKKKKAQEGEVDVDEEEVATLSAEETKGEAAADEASRPAGSEERANSVIKGTLLEYFATGDLVEAMAGLDDLAAPAHMPKVVEHGVGVALEHKTAGGAATQEAGGGAAAASSSLQHWDRLADLLAALMNDGTSHPHRALDAAAVAAELGALVGIIDDLAIDYPFAPRQLGRLAGRIASKASWGLEWALPGPLAMFGAERRHDFVADAVQSANECAGADAAKVVLASFGTLDDMDAVRAALDQRGIVGILDLAPSSS